MRNLGELSKKQYQGLNRWEINDSYAFGSLFYPLMFAGFVHIKSILRKREDLFMKRFLAVIFSAILIGTAFCGCTDSEESSSTAQSQEITASQSTEASAIATDTALADVYAQIKSCVTLPEMIELDAVDKLERYYGITADMIADYAGGIDSSGVGQDEIVIIKADSEEQVETIKEKLQVRYDSKLSQNENYNAEEAEKIRNCSVESSGLYVYMIISNDVDQITQIVTDAIK